MFFTLILENKTGDQINMTATAHQYMTSKIEGLSPPAGTISTSGYAGMDGSYLNNAFIEKRNVVISFEMRGINIETKRHQLYKVVKPSRYIKIYYKTSGIDVFAEGYVESCEVQNFEQFTTGQISIICPDIYWYSTVSQMAYEQQENGETKPIPEDEYIELLKERGKEKIVLPLTASESQIAVQSMQFQYNTDYLVGDYVTVEYQRFGLIQPKIQLIGMIESFDQNGRNLTPTFKGA